MGKHLEQESLAPARRMSQIKHPSMAAPGGFRAAGIEPGNPEMIPMHRGELRMMAAEQKWKEEEERKKAAPVDHKHGMSFPGGYVRPEASDDIEGTMAGGDAFSAPAPDNPLPRVDWKSRWAPKQKDHIEAHRLQSAEHSTEFNIWYGKYEGDRMHQRGNERAGGRCCMDTDSGKTLADTRAKAFMCLHFSRGLCAKGKNCTYHHHLPTPADEKRIGKLPDCFGRERHATDREDMCGVGNFVRESRTLYIGRTKSLPKEELEEQIYRHFSEWGDIQEYRVVEKKQIAFVRYYYRMNAEFAGLMTTQTQKLLTGTNGSALTKRSKLWRPLDTVWWNPTSIIQSIIKCLQRSVSKGVERMICIPILMDNSTRQCQ